MTRSRLEADGQRRLDAQKALTEAYEAAREVRYATGSPEMGRLAQAEAYCAETRYQEPILELLGVAADER